MAGWVPGADYQLQLNASLGHGRGVCGMRLIDKWTSTMSLPREKTSQPRKRRHRIMVPRCIEEDHSRKA